MLIALLLPAVQAARAAAQRMQCSNHIKQWTLAIQTFYDAFQRIPSNGNDDYWWQFKQLGTNQRVDGIDTYGWRTVLLPFVEQQALQSRLVAGCQWAAQLNPYPGQNACYVGIARPWCWDYDNGDTSVFGTPRTPFGEYFDILGCPSDSRATQEFDAQTRGSNYFGCTGDVQIGEDWGENRNTRGVIRYNFGGNSSTYPSDTWGEINFGTVTDGLSNTMVISEVCMQQYPNQDKDRGILTGIARSVNIHGQPPANCLVARGPNGKFSDLITATSGEGKGARWGDARNPYAMYHAALPPNAPACQQGPNLGGNDNCHLITASSHHAGGVNIGLLDGSGRFASESIDAGDPTQRLGASLGNTGEGHAWTGPSTMGVWGALATPSQGESVSL